MFNKKSTVIAGLMVLALVLAGSWTASGYQPYARQAPVELDEETAELQRDIWRINQRLAALNYEYQEMLREDADEESLLALEDEIFELRDELFQLREEFRSERRQDGEEFEEERYREDERRHHQDSSLRDEFGDTRRNVAEYHHGPRDHRGSRGRHGPVEREPSGISGRTSVHQPGYHHNQGFQMGGGHGMHGGPAHPGGHSGFSLPGFQNDFCPRQPRR